MRPSQNLPLPPRIYSPFQPIYMCDSPKIYPSLPEYTPLFNKCIYATLPESTSPSQNIPPFSPTTCDPLKIYPSQIIPSFSTNVYVRPSQNIPLPLKINPLFNNYVRLSQNMPLSPRIYSSPFNNYNIMRPFQNRPLPPRIYPSIFNNYNIM